MKILRDIILIVLVLSLTLGLFSCKRDENVEDTVPIEDTAPVASGISFLDYSVIRPVDIPQNLDGSIAEMYAMLLELSGSDNKFLYDVTADGAKPDADAKEILVGHTNRPETAEVLSQLSANEYAIAVVGNKIVVTGFTENITHKAVEYFVDTYLVDGADGILEAELFYKGIVETVVLVEKGRPKYTLIYHEGASASEKDIFDGVYSYVKSASGVYLPYRSDKTVKDDSVSEILFGYCSYKQTAELKKKSDPSSYRIERIGNKLVIYAEMIEQLEKAASDFNALIKYGCYTDSEGKTTIQIPDDTISGAWENFYTDVPFEVSGRTYDKAFNTEDGTMMLYWAGANEDMLNSYSRKLMEKGFRAYQELENDSIKSITYAKDIEESKGLEYGTMVHIYYLKRVSEFRVITREDAVLPTNPRNYRELCTPAVTQIGIYHDSKVYIGMSYLIRLADGTFVVIDGGNEISVNSERLYNAMVEQKPEEMDEIVITAWILTHYHGDHIGTILDFRNHYQQKVKVKQVIANDMSSFSLSQARFSPSVEGSSMSGAFGGCVYTKCHTGQQFFFPGVTFTILYNQEDALPNYPVEYNDYSVVFDSVINGARFMWLGDVQNWGGTRLVKMYNGDMKCDVMQMAHHGFGGGTLALYQLCNPDIVFWPVGSARANASNSQNNWIRSNADFIYYHHQGNKIIEVDKNGNLLH